MTMRGASKSGQKQRKQRWRSSEKYKIKWWWENKRAEFAEINEFHYSSSFRAWAWASLANWRWRLLLPSDFRQTETNNNHNCALILFIVYNLYSTKYTALPLSSSSGAAHRDSAEPNGRENEGEGREEGYEKSVSSCCVSARRFGIS